MSKADNLQKDGDNTNALGCIWELFKYDKLSSKQLGLGVDVLRRIKPEKLLEIANTPVFKSLNVDKCIWISSELNWCKQGLQASVDLLFHHYMDQKQSVAIAGIVPRPEELSMVEECFNYAMAEWGLKKRIPKDMFANVVELDSQKKRLHSTNYFQCMAVSYWAVAKPEEGLQKLDSAIKIILEEPSAEFSCWGYLTVTPEEFREDYDLIKWLIRGVIAERVRRVVGRDGGQ